MSGDGPAGHAARLGAIARFAALLAAVALHCPAMAQAFGPPLRCTPGLDCFLQQTADLGPGSAVADSYCGTASYDGHAGIDIRVLSLADLGRDVAVLAMADGTVAGTRDGEPDRLVRSDHDRAPIRDRECGNGVLLDHGGGLVTQYCHLERGSVAVARGQAVRRGDLLGHVGASGLAQFPHVHAEARLDGISYDILTGRPAGGGCEAAPLAGAPLLEPGFAAALGNGDAVLLAAGLAGAPLQHASLAADGPPAQAAAGSQATIGWAWFANLKGGDVVTLRLEWPDGRTFATGGGEALDRAKASYSLFAGRGRPPQQGEYRLGIEVVRDGAPIVRAERRFRVE